MTTVGKCLLYKFVKFFEKIDNFKSKPRFCWHVKLVERGAR